MMRSGYYARFAGTVLVLAMVLGAGGCGFKTDPVPPASIVPEAIDDLRYTVDDKGVTLNWTYPVETIQGSNIVDISAFDVYRATVALEDVCDTCPIPFGEPMEIPGGETVEAGKPKVAVYQTSLLRPGHKYFFKVRSRTSWWAASADSNIVSFVWTQPPVAPAGLSATPGDSLISLSWEPVTTLVDGRPVEGSITYQLLRSEEGKEFEALGEPSAATSYRDSLVINGRKYFYKVQSLLSYQGHLVNGGMSAIISAEPVDQTPPPVPAGVVAVETDAGVKIVWEPVSDEQVAGYRVYRRAADRQQPELIGEVAVPYSLFVDSKADGATRYYYSVSAVDGATPANESDLSREATTR
ncbi:MAG: hypothetical protein RBS34_16050 [Desulfofustis sp.]|jgi:hypothetical protein|nr:hypothetical protein [Desulfofustis sp.]